jgi:GTP-binding protein HflX
MIELDPRGKMVRRALLVGVYEKPSGKTEAESLLAELGELVDTLGVPICRRMLVHTREVHPRFLIGSGKAEEISQILKEEELDSLIFDNELSPSQQRNWEKLTGVTVLDRQEVILDIFAQRAQTHEARLQIDLARMEYALPRLTRAWGHLVRQGGGIGAKGEGESQLEQDKRRIRVTIGRLKEQLEHVRQVRSTQRKDRKRAPVPNAAIVGYTNAGKSSLMRRLTGAGVLVEDKLFATLDTTVRALHPEVKPRILVSDTVGFIKKLPHDLVASFKSTLDEALEASHLLHVVDASDPSWPAQLQVTRDVLAEIGADAVPTTLILNKIDRLDEGARADLAARFPEAWQVSAKNPDDVASLRLRIIDLFERAYVEASTFVPYTAQRLVAAMHESGRVLQETYGDEGVTVRWSAPAAEVARITAALRDSQP